MGFCWLNKAKDEDQKVLNNTEMTLAIKESTDKMMTSMIGDILALNGTSLEEIPAEYVLLYNKYVRQYNEMFGICLKLAAYQDERDKKLDKIIELLEKDKIWKQTTVGRIENIHQLIKADKKGGDRS